MGLQTVFVHLRLHTEYSLVDSVVRVPELMRCRGGGRHARRRAHRRVQPVRDGEVLPRGARAGVKPLIGVDLLMREAATGTHRRGSRCCARTKSGYLNLSRLVSARLPRRASGRRRRWSSATGSTRAHRRGLIALSGAWEGDVGRALLTGRRAQARRLLQDWKSLFGDRYYLELQRIGRATRRGLCRRAPWRWPPSAACRWSPPMTCASCSRAISTRTRRASASTTARLLADPTRRRRYHARAVPAHVRSRWRSCSRTCPRRSPTRWRSRAAAACALKLGASRLPVYPGAGRHPAEDLHPQHVPPRASRALRRPAGQGRDAHAARAATQRASMRELDVICSMGFAGYFLIVADFIRWARENGVPVGPGRGSGAGSLVAWVLGITDLDPDRARPAVRALPESGTRVDARLRRRLLHGRPRPRHRLRGRQATAASACRRSSPTAPWRRRRWCATWAACSGIPTASSTASPS